MKANTMLETIMSLLGTSAHAIPLSCCKLAKEYLLKRHDIPHSGTVILFSIPYLMTEDARNPQRNVSLYAVPRDYHGYVKELENTLIPALERYFPANRFALFSDHSPIFEVNAAARAGLGVVGMNGLLITQEYGSFVFIGELVTDADFETVTGQHPNIPSDAPTCEKCGACLRTCPSGCLTAPSQPCLSALTQTKRDLSESEVQAIRSNGSVWGCDACQLACPHNAKVIRNRKNTPIRYFQEQRLAVLDTGMIDHMDDEELLSRAYAWRGRAVIRRNAALFEASNEPEERRKS